VSLNFVSQLTTSIGGTPFIDSWWVGPGQTFRETKWSVVWFDCDESLTWRCLNLNPGHFGGSTTFIFVSFEESCLLVS
jgi:hypothetical protein